MTKSWNNPSFDFIDNSQTVAAINYMSIHKHRSILVATAKPLKDHSGF